MGVTAASVSDSESKTETSTSDPDEGENGCEVLAGKLAIAPNESVSSLGTAFTAGIWGKLSGAESTVGNE
jgi:hypothetical protein